jgi:hypothetical protein
MSDATNVTSINDSLSIKPFVVNLANKESLIISRPKDHTLAAMRLFFDPGDIVEMQAFHHDITGRSQNGYYTDHQKLVDDSVILSNSEYNHIYYAINKVDPDAVKRKNRKLNEYVNCKTGEAVSAGDVLKRTLLAIDFDLVRAEGYSKSCATDEEKQHGKECAGVVVSYLHDRGWLLPYKVDSGNGVHLYYIIDLPNTSDSQQLIKSFAAVLAAKFDNEHVHIDQSLDDANQLMRLPGTQNCKGEHTPERPHRLCCFTEIPDRRPIVSRAQIEEVIKELGGSIKKAPGKKTRKQGTHRRTEAEVDAEARAISEKLGTEIKKIKVEQNNGGKLYTLICPFCHQDKGHIWLAYSGAKTFDCKDDDCIGKKKYGKKIEWWQFAKEFDLPSYGDEPLCNYYEFEDEEGKVVRKNRPLPEVAEELIARCGGFPKSFNGILFFEDAGKITECREPHKFWGEVQNRISTVSIAQGQGYATKKEIYAVMEGYTDQYAAYTTIDHYPRIDSYYYACEELKEGDGTALETLLDFFSYETDEDRQLFTAAFATPLWGGLPGKRPMFFITSLDAHGSGKSEAAAAIGKLYGGYISLERDVADLKTRILSSAEATNKRVIIRDNLKAWGWSDQDFESFITSDIISGRRNHMGEGRMPNYFTVLVTGNGASLDTDIAQRSVEIHLIKPDAYTENWADKLDAYIAEHREAILGDLLAFLKRPKNAMADQLRFSSWGPDVLARCNNPDRLLKKIKERQAISDTETEMFTILTDSIRQHLISLSYDPDIERIQIPFKLMNAYYRDSKQSDKKATIRESNGVVRQGIGSGQLQNLTDYRKTKIRSFVWTGDAATDDTPIQDDIKARMEYRNDKYLWALK